MTYTNTRTKHLLSICMCHIMYSVVSATIEYNLNKSLYGKKIKTNGRDVAVIEIKADFNTHSANQMGVASFIDIREKNNKPKTLLK